MENILVTLLPLDEEKSLGAENTREVNTEIAENSVEAAKMAEIHHSAEISDEMQTLELCGYKESAVVEEICEAEKSVPHADTRTRKEKFTAAITHVRGVLNENKSFNSEALAKWKAEKAEAMRAFAEKVKGGIKALPERTKTYFKSIPDRAKKTYEKAAEEVATMKREGTLAKKTAIHILLGIWALIVLFPFYYMIITSLKSYGGFNSEVDIFSKIFVTNPTFESYVTAFTAVELGKYFLNTLIFTVITTGVMLIVTVLASYGFARINFKGKNLVFTAFLSMMMIPAELVVITNFITITNLDMRNTFAGLILPSITSVFYIYLLKENFQQVPNELYYAAKVDGTSDLKYLFKVMIPICQPTIVTVTILKVIECWNSYVWPRLVTDNEKYYLISNGIQAIRESGFGRDNVPAMMAAVVAISVPLIVLFLIFRNKIMEGVARGGTKG